MATKATGKIADAEAAKTRKSKRLELRNAPPNMVTTRAMAHQAAAGAPAQGPEGSNAVKKRKAESGLGNIQPTKKRRGATGVVAQGHAVSPAATGVARAARHVPRQETAETDVRADQGDDTFQREVADLQEQISSLNEDIATNTTNMKAIEKEIGKITEKLDLIQDFLVALADRDTNTLEELFEKNRWIKSIITPTQERDVQEKALRDKKTQLLAKETQLRAEKTQLLAEKTQLRDEKKELLAMQKIDKQRLLAQTKLLEGDTMFANPSSKLTDQFQSGLVYIKDTFRIERVGHEDSNGIGLLKMETNGTVNVKENINYRDISGLLRQAWEFRNKDFSTDEVVEEFCKLVPSLSERDVKSACRGLLDEFEFDTEPPPGEMTFQQRFCAPLATLLMAAAGAKGPADPSYKADEEVLSSLSVLKIDDHESVQKVFKIKPDSAANLFGEWDAFGMLEIKHVFRNAKSDLVDYDRSVLMTAVTAIVVRNCIEEEDYENVVLPFVIWRGHIASLYVTTLNANGIPVVLLVKDSNEWNSKLFVLSKSPCMAKKELFIAFAVLLNNFKNFFETSVKEKYMLNIKQRTAELIDVPRFGITQRSTGRNTQENDDERTDGKPRSNRSRKTPEQYAKEAAEYDGMFSHLFNPFDIFMDFTENDIKDNAQTVSPFYFRGRDTLSGREIFFKVWKANEVDVHRVTAEWSYHYQAFKAGVPVAEPVLSELARTTCSRGFEYLLFATEFIHKDVIETIDDLWDFSCSLIEAVLMLHEKAKLLHGDIKRGNMRWNRNGVRLIDFEHAQEISNPRFAPGTKGYQAPEILEQMPCSKQTDAFSVGQTIIRELADFRKWDNGSCEDNQTYIQLHELSMRLTALNPDERWSLSQARVAMQSSKKTASSYE